jgi:hypothetical protein
MSEEVSREQTGTAAAEQQNRDLLRRYLASNDAHCPRCIFNLRGNTNGRCPECGEPILIGVRSSSRAVSQLWLSGYLGLGTGLGMPCSLLGYYCFSHVRGGLVIYRPPLDNMLVALLAVASVAFLLYLWWKHRDSIDRQSLIARTWLAAACWGISVLSTIVIIAYVG